MNKNSLGRILSKIGNMLSSSSSGRRGTSSTTSTRGTRGTGGGGLVSKLKRLLK